MAADRSDRRVWAEHRMVVPFAADDAADVGALAGRAAASDVVDVHVVMVAYRLGRGVLTADEGDLRSIADALPARVAIVPL